MGKECQIKVEGTCDKVKVDGVTLAQAVVFYDDDNVIGGETIVRIRR